MSDFKKMLAGAQPAARTVPICLRGDLVAELQELELKAVEARKSTSKEGDGIAEIVEQIQALQAEMRDNTKLFQLRALPPRKYRALKAKYPPRRGEDGEIVLEDRDRDFSLEMIPELIRVSTTDPELTEDEWRELLGDTDAEADRREAAGEPVEDGKLTDAQSWQLGNAAFALNEGEINIPFSSAVLLTSHSSGGESKLQTGSESHPRNSTAANPSKPSATSTTGGAG